MRLPSISSMTASIMRCDARSSARSLHFANQPWSHETSVVVTETSLLLIAHPLFSVNFFDACLIGSNGEILRGFCVNTHTRYVRCGSHIRLMEWEAGSREAPT